MKIALSTAVLAGLVAPAFSLSYLESLNPVSVSPSGGSVANGASYLNALKTSSAPSGAGMTSYLDALPKNSAPSMAGSGMASYADSLGRGATRAPVAASPAPAAPSAPATVASTLAPVNPVTARKCQSLFTPDIHPAGL